MQMRGLGHWPGFKKFIGLTLTILLGLLWLVNPGTVQADSGSTGTPATSLTIKAGYFGMPYKTMKVFSVSDLEAMPQVQQAYTFIDSMPAVVTASARGVKLTELLTKAGIDVNSVEVFYFYTTDIHKGWYQTLNRSYLLDTERYYYPNLPAHWDSDTQSALPGAEEGAIPVEPIIAIEDHWERFATSPDFTRMTGDQAFRLMFGQADTSTRTANKSAKWVHEISVMLKGAPPEEVTLDRDTADLLVGSSTQLTATVTPADAINKSVTWSSSDTKVATVDNDGLVTVIAPGTAAITATTVEGDRTATCIVNAVQGGVEQSKASAGTGSQEQTPAKPQPPEAEDQQYLAEKDGKSGHVFEVSVDTVPLQLETEQNGLNLYAGMIFVLLFLVGAGGRYLEYTKEVLR